MQLIFSKTEKIRERCYLQPAQRISIKNISSSIVDYQLRIKIMSSNLTFISSSRVHIEVLLMKSITTKQFCSKRKIIPNDCQIENGSTWLVSLYLKCFI